MRRFSASLLVLLATTSYVYGQESGSGGSRGLVGARPVATASQEDGSAGYGCPVGLFAERRADLVTRLAADGHDPGPAQGLHVRLIQLAAPQIESAEITVYGVTLRPVELPVGVAASNKVSKTFVLHPDDRSKGLQEATVWMHEVGALTRVELNSLKYADGSAWHESAGSQCRAVPSLFLPVGLK